VTYCLQSRWVLQGRTLVYYGLRNREHLFQNRIRLTRRQAVLVAGLPGPLDARSLRQLKPLLGTCVVEEHRVRPVPRSLREAVFCTDCCANDFMIPGLEFDSRGRCPMCQTAEDTRHLRSLVPLVTDIPRSRHSRFDAALFYTGGKDSTYLLHHLVKVKGLRILALTWETPFMSDTAKQSIANARQQFPTVEFRSRAVEPETMKRIYRRLYALSENTCACPSLAYVLFYPDLAAERVPYFLAGNEPAQMLGLYYNHMAPKLAYTFPDNRFLQGLVNLGRLATLRPPLKRGQFHTLATMKQLTGRSSWLQRWAGYSNELVDNIVAALQEAPQLLEPLRRSLRRSSRTGQIPAFVHLDLDAISGGAYDWRAVKDLLVRECGWVAPPEDSKSLHTSCRIETCKEHTQFLRFYQCRSTMIPFSALELSLASRGRSLSRADAIRELEQNLGFSLTEVPACSIMREALL